MAFEPAPRSELQSPDPKVEDKANESALRRFAESTAGASAAPVLGLVQLAGNDISSVKVKHDGSMADTAGGMLGSAALYTTAIAALKFIPGVGGKIASAAAGALLGFLNPVEDGQGLETRIGNGALGAGLMLGLSLAQAGLSKFGEATAAARQELAVSSQTRSSMLGTAFNPQLSLMASLDSVVPKSALGQVVTSNAVLGGAYTQLDSKINRGEWADFTNTATGAGMFALVGAAAHGTGKLFGKANTGEHEQSGASQTEKAVAPAEAAPVETQPRPARNFRWSDLKYAASYEHTSVLDQGLKLDHPEEIPTFVHNYFSLDTRAGAKIEEAIRSGQVKAGSEGIWQKALEETTAARAHLEGPLAAARAGDANAQASIEAMNKAIEPLTAEAKSIGESPSFHIQQKLTDTDRIRTYAWQRYAQEGASALYDMQASTEVGVVPNGTETAWKSVTSELEAYRKDLQKSLQERFSLSSEVSRALPPRSQERLLAELQEHADATAQRDFKWRPGLGFIKSGMQLIGNAEERQMLVDYTFEKYPSIASGLLRQELKEAIPRSSGVNYVWDRLIGDAEKTHAQRAPKNETQLIDELKAAARNRNDDYLALGMKTLTKPAEIETFVDHYMDKLPDVAPNWIRQTVDYGVVSKGSEQAWEKALKQRQQWAKFAEALPESETNQSRPAFYAWHRTQGETVNPVDLANWERIRAGMTPEQQQAFDRGSAALSS